MGTVLFFKPGLPLPSYSLVWTGLSLVLMSQYGRASRLAVCTLNGIFSDLPADSLFFSGFYFPPALRSGYYLSPFALSVLPSGHSLSFLHLTFPFVVHIQILPTHIALLGSTESAYLPSASMWELQHYVRLITTKMGLIFPLSQCFPLGPQALLMVLLVSTLPVNHFGFCFFFFPLPNSVPSRQPPSLCMTPGHPFPFPVCII